MTKAYGIGLQGIEGILVDVEVGAVDGLPGLDITGLPSASIREARHRVRTALRTLKFKWPQSRLVINLGPADCPKSGTGYDFPLAVAVMAHARQLPIGALADSAFWGELSLHGVLREAPGGINVALAARGAGIKRLYVPMEVAPIAAAVKGIDVFGVSSLAALSEALHGDTPLKPASSRDDLNTNERNAETSSSDIDMADVREQVQAKRALELAAAGGHNVLMVGPPGCGKTLLARALTGILPPLSMEERISVTRLHTMRGGAARRALIHDRPFRAPHPSSTLVSLVGGGSPIVPGEVSLAHHGVLFLDETPEFSRRTLESLRMPIEDGSVAISRATETIKFPSLVTLVCAMNPCPCGYRGDRSRDCRCTPLQVERYRRRISGPMLDRIGIRIRLEAVSARALWARPSTSLESSETIRRRVSETRQRQKERAERLQVAEVNASLKPAELERACGLSKETQAFMTTAAIRLGLSARGVHRVLRVARTAADHAEAPDVEQSHVLEALNYRGFD